jgi:hypothetical protein
MTAEAIAEQPSAASVAPEDDAHVLAGLEPPQLWHYFGEICRIPRPSKHEHRILDYLKRFADQRQLSYRQVHLPCTPTSCSCVLAAAAAAADVRSG